nr:Chain C, synthetic ssrA peptide [synthetic construct]1OU8_D Chain D, synthetic ssrA peptide [synthetic construct]
GRHGAANDENY